MKKTRSKYKVRAQRGCNTMRRLWKRTEWSHMKWKVQGAMRRVRTPQEGELYKRPRKITPRKRRTNRERLGGVKTLPYGKRKDTFKKKRRGRKARTMRYGGGVAAGPARRRRSRQRSFTLSESGFGQGRRGERVLESYGGRSAVDRRRRQRKASPEHRRGQRERRAEIRRWRAGRVETRREGRGMRKRGEVRRRIGRKTASPSTEYGIGYDPQSIIEVGSGRQVAEPSWKGRKGRRKAQQLGRGPKTTRRARVRVRVRGRGRGRLRPRLRQPRRVRRRRGKRKMTTIPALRNGRTMLGYARVDYRTGARRVRRAPRTGERRRPARRQMTRAMRRK